MMAYPDSFTSLLFMVNIIGTIITITVAAEFTICKTIAVSRKYSAVSLKSFLSLLSMNPQHSDVHAEILTVLDIEILYNYKASSVWLETVDLGHYTNGKNFYCL
jgi:hypothetical protein